MFSFRLAAHLSIRRHPHHRQPHRQAITNYCTRTCPAASDLLKFILIWMEVCRVLETRDVDVRCRSGIKIYK